MTIKKQSSINTLVIGGAGYIGKHILPLLLTSNRNVTVIGRKPASEVELINSVSYVQGDFGNSDLLKSLLENHQEVINLAYATVPNTSYENPLGDLLENLPPIIQLFKMAADKGTKLLLVSSGGTVYGDSNHLPILETSLTKPISPYGVTKLTIESYAYLYAMTHGLKFICVRPSNAYGPGQKPFIGQGFISTALASAIKGIPIKIFGQAGTIRDYLYVSDLARGIVNALEYGHLSETYNLGSGMALSNMDVINSIKKIPDLSNTEILIEHMPERSFDVKANVLDSSKLQIHTGWIPQVALMDGLIQTQAWLRLKCLVSK